MELLLYLPYLWVEVVVDRAGLEPVVEAGAMFILFYLVN
jgi:hypothetical protein